jgi:hypothetical protein
MLHRKKFIWAATLVSAFAALDGSRTMGVQKDSVPKSQDKLALGDEDVKQLFMLINTAKAGKISKKEWMDFMEAEFERLDKHKNGELDVKELAQSNSLAGGQGLDVVINSKKYQLSGFSGATCDTL